MGRGRRPLKRKRRPRFLIPDRPVSSLPFGWAAKLPHGHARRSRERQRASPGCPRTRECPEEKRHQVRASDESDSQNDLDGAHRPEPKGAGAGLVGACGREPSRENPRQGLHGRTQGGKYYGVYGVHRTCVVSNKGRLTVSKFTSLLSQCRAIPPG
jgi:hypothetical protein